jgi:carbon-monoxide dehydrogenase medium subunit
VPDLYVPTQIDDAVAFLAGHPAALPVAGGTDLVIDARVGRVRPDWLVDLTPLGFADVTWDGDSVRIGAMTRIRALELDERLAARAAAVVEAARVLGSVQIRTMATVGGNICHATPSAEMPPALLVHDAVAEVAGPDGARELPLADVFAGPGRTTLANSELLTGVRLRAGAGSCYLRQTVRWSMDLAGVGVAASVDAEGRALVALGAVAPTPLLLDVTGAVDRAGEIAAEACSPITDARGTAEYRRQVTRVLTERALRIASLRASGEWPSGVPAPINGVLSG